MNYAEDRLDRRSRRTSVRNVHGDIAVDLQRAEDTFERLRGTSTPTVSAELRSAHELAGKALRDKGANAEATRHFGLAWKFAREGEDEWAAVGDYAQMCELAGYPEIGALALLFCHSGGRLAGLADAESDLQADPTIACYIAFPPMNTVINKILDSFESFSDQIQTIGILTTASDVLGALSISHKGQKGDAGDQLKRMRDFIMRQDQSPVEVPCVLQFWDGEGNSSRSMPPVIQLLLLKLLFSSPFGGPFLELACLSMAFLPLHFPTAGPVGRMMARNYKSHWAYYVFIRYLILGEKIKKHRLADKALIRHRPVWDTVLVNSDGISCDKMQCRLSDHCRRVLNELSTDGKGSSVTISAPALAIAPLYVIGDSHVLSLAWQTIKIGHSRRILIPYPATGLKAWHVRQCTKFFTHSNLHTVLRRLPFTNTDKRRTIILSAGEIDCREGIGGSLIQGYYNDCSDAVTRTVEEYLNAVASLAEQYTIQILIMPVAPHAYRSEKNGKSTGRAARRQTTHLFNQTLRHELLSPGKKKYDYIFLLDYEEFLHEDDANSPTGYVLNRAYNADFTHVSGAVVKLLENSLQSCGCDNSII